MLAAILTFILAATLIVLLPGPDTLVVIRSLLKSGKKVAGLTAAGVLSGLVIWVFAATIGLSAMLSASRVGYLSLRLVGAGYLIWLGVQTIKNRRAGLELDGDERSPRLIGEGYRAGLATDLLNPKVGVFFVTFLPGFVPAGHQVGTTVFFFGVIFILETAAYFFLLLTLAGRIQSWMRNSVIRRRLNTATGLVLVGFGIRLAVD